jgi:hypothetical protein
LAEIKPWQVVVGLVVLAYLFVAPFQSAVNNLIPQGGNSNNVGSSGGSTVIQTTPDSTTLSFKMYDKYAPTTELTAQNVTVYGTNGGRVKLGTIAESGTTSVAPGDKIELEWGSTDEAPGTTYYAIKEEKTVPSTKGQFNLQADLPAVSTSPTLTWYDENGDTNTALALGVSEDYSAEFRIKSEANKCYGNPSTGKKNVACFRYATNETSRIKYGTGASVSLPQTMTNVTSGFSWSCYEFNVICDNADYRAPLTVTTTSTQPDSTSSSIAVCLEDTAYYKDADDDMLKAGYTDENNNALGAAVVCNSISIS